MLFGGDNCHKLKEEGRRKKEEGRGKKEEGRRKKEEGRGKRGYWLMWFSSCFWGSIDRFESPRVRQGLKTPVS
ncbi:MAG: hypothetical protein ACRC62_24680 [Microcoleus sp.]